MSAGRPNRWTGQMAFVRGVMAAATRSGSMSYVSGSMSTNTGVAPAYRIDDTVALKVWPTVMTSSPGSRSIPAKMHISATVPLLTAIAWRTPMNAAQRSSSSATRRPPASIPLRRTSVTAAISASSMSGRATGITAAPRGACRPCRS